MELRRSASVHSDGDGGKKMNGANMIPRFSLSFFADRSSLIELVVCICQRVLCRSEGEAGKNIRGGGGRRDIRNQA
jgi:hypothetical protein